MRTPRVHVNHGPIGSCGNLPGIDVGTTPALPGWGPPAGKGGSVLEDVVADLACPHGDPSLTLDGRTLVCPAGHRFDVARQGYVNLLLGPAPAAADTPAMVAARELVQAAGHQQAISDALVAAVRAAVPAGPAATVADVGAGTGHHLAAVVEATGAPAGLAIDLSKHAARRAARAHPRIGAIVADVWRGLPVRAGAAAVVLVVFAPRDPEELARILRPDGVLVVVTPTPRHLEPLVEQLGLLQVDENKTAILDRSLSPVVTLEGREVAEDVRHLVHDEVAAIVAMGPSAHHLDPATLDGAMASLPERVEVRVSVTVSTYRRR
jgi:23S rRNA (guanine745-N1)-methyltransferase